MLTSGIRNIFSSCGREWDGEKWNCKTDLENGSLEQRNMRIRTIFDEHSTAQVDDIPQLPLPAPLERRIKGVKDVKLQN